MITINKTQTNYFVELPKENFKVQGNIYFNEGLKKVGINVSVVNYNGETLGNASYQDMENDFKDYHYNVPLAYRAEVMAALDEVVESFNAYATEQ